MRTDPSNTTRETPAPAAHERPAPRPASASAPPWPQRGDYPRSGLRSRDRVVARANREEERKDQPAAAFFRNEL